MAQANKKQQSWVQDKVEFKDNFGVKISCQRLNQRRICTDAQ